MGDIRTYSGLKFDPTKPSSDYVRLEDIAHALSMLCRANGHFREFFSVGLHSINCAAEAEARGLSNRVRLACLLHDASEAYLSDLTRPIKAELPEYRILEERMQMTVFEKFELNDLTDEESAEVCEIDDAMLYHEFRHYMNESLFDITPPIYSEPIFSYVPFSEVEGRFLSMAQELMR